MRYRAEIDYDPISEDAGTDCASAKVRPSTWTKIPSLALRHARAMAAVIRAAKALQNARWAQVKRTNWSAWDAAYDKAMTVHDLAVDRLVAVEKEVERG